MSKRLLITNCKLYNAPEDKQTTSILIKNGIISQIGQVDSTTDGNILDAKERIIAPGFIDVHIQGAGRADVLDATAEALQTISRTCARFGTTSFLATTVFRPNQQNNHLSLLTEHVGSNLCGANLLGIHLEGPFISPEKRAMVPSECLCPASMQVLDNILNITDSHLKMMTIAPEVPDNTQIIRRLVRSNIIASFGHSNADYEQTLDGFKAGISHVTHLFNAMPPIHHRSPGPLIAIYESKNITAQLITDGVHIHPGILKFAYDILGQNRIILITDGMRSLGLPDGKYIYDGVEYETKDGIAKNNNGTLIGTGLGLSQLLKRFMTFTGCPLDVAIKTITENPAKLLGIDKNKGKIEAGKDADLVLLNQDCSVHTTIVAGSIVFQE